MNLYRAGILIATIIVSIFCIITLYDLVEPVLTTKQIGLMFSTMILFWISMEFGVFAFTMIMSDFRNKRIQKELDMERSFQKMAVHAAAAVIPPVHTVRANVVLTSFGMPAFVSSNALTAGIILS